MVGISPGFQRPFGATGRMGGPQIPRHFGFDNWCLWQITARPSRHWGPGLEINGAPATTDAPTCMLPRWSPSPGTRSIQPTASPSMRMMRLSPCLISGM